MCLFIIFLVTLLVVNIFDSMTAELSALRNAIDRDRALYLANAAVHSALSELEGNVSWRGTLTDGAYPADNTYSASVVDDVSNTVLVTARGVSGSITRTIVATVQL